MKVSATPMKVSATPMKVTATPMKVTKWQSGVPISHLHAGFWPGCQSACGSAGPSGVTQVNSLH
jgi:hypothetical protein